MNKIFFNFINGSIIEGYKVNYINDLDESISLKIIVSSSSSTSYMFKDELRNSTFPFTPKYTSPFFTNVYFEYASDMSFFNPYSVPLLYENTSMNFGYAFPLQYGNWRKTTSLASIPGRSSSLGFLPGGFIPTKYSSSSFSNSWLDEVNVSFVDEEFKEDNFTLSISTDVGEIERQLGDSWLNILNDEVNRYAIGAYYPITTSNTITYESKVCLTSGYINNNILRRPRGLIFEDSSFQAGEDVLWTVTENVGIKQEDVYFPDKSNFIQKQSSSSYEVVYNYSSDILYFTDQVYVLSSSSSSAGMFLLAIYNPNNEEEYFLQSISTLGRDLNFPNVDFSSDACGKITLRKYNNNTWRLEFIGNSFLDNKNNKSTLINYYEGEGDPKEGITLSYVNDEEITSEIYIYPFSSFRSGYTGFQIPTIMNDWRFFPTASENSYIQYSYINMNGSKLRNDYYTDDYYICVDQASYSILI